MAPRAYNSQVRQQQQAQLRARIAAAAARLHADQGVLGTSYADVAQAAEVSVPTVYKHYPALDDLVQACTGHVAAGAPPWPVDAILGAPDLPAAAQALVAAMDATHAYYQPWLAWREHQHLPVLARIEAQERARLLELCQVVLQRHTGTPGLRSAAAWWVALLGFELRQNLLSEHGESRPSYRRTLVHLLLAVAGPQRAAPPGPRPTRKS